VVLFFIYVILIIVFDLFELSLVWVIIICML